jgi:hypothetical protein
MSGQYLPMSSTTTTTTRTTTACCASSCSCSLLVIGDELVGLCETWCLMMSRKRGGVVDGDAGGRSCHCCYRCCGAAGSSCSFSGGGGGGVVCWSCQNCVFLLKLRMIVTIALSHCFGSGCWIHLTIDPCGLVERSAGRICERGWQGLQFRLAVSAQRTPVSFLCTWMSRCGVAGVRTLMSHP